MTASLLRTACVLTCHNRREKTLACLAALRRCSLPEGVRLTVYLVDDGSRDGTADAVRAAFPEVNLLSGDGNLFWNGGMRVGLAAAMAQGHDDYLWLNDDTLLDADALVRLYECRQSVQAPAACIVVGATRDDVTGQLTYGGLANVGRPWAHHYAKLAMGEQAQACLTFNGNCVLVSGAAVARLGNLGEGFVHGLGDWDYGLRAARANIPAWVAPGFVGTCSHNPPARFSPAAQRSVRERLRHVCGPKQYPPRVWLAYVRKHFPALWPVYFVRPYGGAVFRALRAKLGGGA